MKALVCAMLVLVMSGCAMQPQQAANADSICRSKQFQPGSSEFAQCLVQQEPVPVKHHGIRYCRRGVFCQNL